MLGWGVLKGVSNNIISDEQLLNAHVHLHGNGMAFDMKLP